MVVSGSSPPRAANVLVRQVVDDECVAMTTPYARELFVRCGSAPRRQAMAGAADQSRRLYRRLARALTRRGANLLHVVAETVFCRNLASDRATLLESRREAYRQAGMGDSCLPALRCIEQPPCDCGQAFELQAYAVAPSRPHGPRVEIIPGNGNWPTASLVELAGVKHLYVGDIAGQDRAGRPAASFAEQCDAMFDRADRLLQARGSTFRDVVRTWCCLSQIDRDYATFNDCRSRFFRSQGIARLPASTGIGAGLGSRQAQCGLGLYAVMGAAEVPIEALHSPTLNEAPTYGALFSRGLRLHLPDKTVLLISGTASVDERGATAHVGDVAGQVARMLRNVSRLLESGVADWDDVVQLVVYLKSAEYLPVFRAAWQAHGLPPLPMSIVRAELCRPELLCEMEAVRLLPPDGQRARLGASTDRQNDSR